MARSTCSVSLRRRLLPGAALSLALILSNAPNAAAQPPRQTPPAGDQGPRFGNWGPGLPPPAAAGPSAAPPAGEPVPGTLPQAPAPSTGAAPGAAAPSAPAPNAPAPAPAPNYWGGCNWNLGGSWTVAGRQEQPSYRTYRSVANVTQYGQWVQIEQDDGISYYGRCRGNDIELDVYSGGQFLGYQNGSFNYFGGGWSRWNAARIQFSWDTYVPSYSAGQETWHRW